MIYDLSANLKTRSGDDVKDDKGSSIKMGEAIVNALDTLATNEQATGIEKSLRWKIGLKLFNANYITDLTPEEVVLCKDCIGRMYHPLVVGQIWEVLDKKDV